MSSLPKNQTVKRGRPLSPHLQVYRLPYNAIMSISGRAVGIGLALALIVILGWFISVVWNPALYVQTLNFIDTPFTIYGFMAFAFVVFFYLGNGLRHVLWDMGIGVNEKAGILTGNIVLLIAFILTFILWEVTCGCWSGMFFSNEVDVLEGVQNVE